jgi:small subunit ribosomal protein S3
MGQKVNPYGFRLGITTDWKSRWFSERQYTDYLIEDWKIRDSIMRKLDNAAISRIEVERTRDKLRVDIPNLAHPDYATGKELRRNRRY